MDLALNIRRLWRHETLWRFVDALAPRGFSFVMHTYLIWRFGADSYALPAWFISTFGLVCSFIPDPSGYVLLARGPAQARGRARLFSSWLWGKMFITVGASLLAVFIFAEPLLASTPPEAVAWIVSGGVAFALSETLWSACSTNRFAMGTLTSWAQIGVIMRAAAFAAAVVLHRLLGIGVGHVLLIFSAPLFLASLMTLPRPTFSRRSWIAGLFALRHYSLWAQMNGFLLAFMGQSPVFFAGTMLTLAPAATGQLAYAVRVLNFIVQPLMVLQSVIVRAYAREGAAHLPIFRLYRFCYRGAGGAVLAITVVLAWLAPGIAPALWMLGGSLALFTAFRFEFALLNALRDVRFLSVSVFLPVTLLFVLLVLPLRGNLSGVAFAVAIGYVALTILLVIQARRRIAFVGGTG